MRNFLIFSCGLLAAYWVDETYCNGIYHRAAIDLLEQIIIHFR